jgi:hypothetical protein
MCKKLQNIASRPESPYVVVILRTDKSFIMGQKNKGKITL